MIRIAQISDCHLFADAGQSGYRHIIPYLSLARVLDDIALQTIDLLLITGDLSADGSIASYQHFKELLHKSQIRCPFVILPGNHDEPAVLEQQFAPPDLWLAYPSAAPLSLNNWQIHLLNTKTQGTGGYLPEAELQALSQSLQNSAGYFQLVAAHHHPFACESWMDAHGWQNGAELVQVLHGFTSVKAMVYGHIHAQSEKNIGACCYLSCPSTCWQWAMQTEFGLSEQAPAYRLLNLTESGQVNSQIITVEYP